MYKESLPKLCCMNVGGHSVKWCGQEATVWYKHYGTEDICSYCEQHDYDCGEKINIDPLAESLGISLQN